MEEWEKFGNIQNLNGWWILCLPVFLGQPIIDLFQCWDANGKMSKVGAILLSVCTAQLARSAKRVVVEFREAILHVGLDLMVVFFCWLTALSPFSRPDDHFDRATVFLFSYLSVVNFWKLHAIPKNQRYTSIYLDLDANGSKLDENEKSLRFDVLKFCIFSVLFSNRMKKGEKKFY